MKYLESALHEFNKYKAAGEKAMAQLDDGQLYWKPQPEANNIAVLIQHLSGNMVSRWTDFLTTDGEKPTRSIAAEFQDERKSREELMMVWSKGWKHLHAGLAALNEGDLSKTITIRAEPHSVVQAINRQIAHCAYHVGQIVWIAKALQAEKWKPLK
jgi:hypothetical protein